MDPGDGSMDGWSWSMNGRVTSTEEVTRQLNYAGVDRGTPYESEGSNLNVPIGLNPHFSKHNEVFLNDA
jgi:hypothetical protein